MVILGISIGTRSSGIAILDSGKLTRWDTLSFKKMWSERKADKIVSKYELYLEAHSVTVVVLKIPPLSHQTEALVILLNKIQELLTYKGCMVEYKTKKEIKKALPEVRNTKQLMNHVVALYPRLTPYYERELKNKNPYYEKIFEAVIVAHLCKKE
jgi:RNase H-fold protein (predicted Holliday junction resolvase)